MQRGCACGSNGRDVDEGIARGQVATCAKADHAFQASNSPLEVGISTSPEAPPAGQAKGSSDVPASTAALFQTESEAAAQAAAQHNLTCARVV